jgi:hypothetical protein
MGGAKHVHRTARPPRSLPTVGMTAYFCVIFLSRGARRLCDWDDIYLLSTVKSASAAAALRAFRATTAADRVSAG